VFREVTRTQSEEVFVLSVVVIILLSAWLTNSFGLSMALGAFLTGIMLGENEFRHQVELDIRPFKDILMGLFFASVGMQIDYSLLAGAQAPAVLLGIALLILVKASVTAIGSMVLGEPMTTALKTGIILAQASEFGFAMLIVARDLGVIGPELASQVLLIALGSLVIAPFAIRYNFELAQLLVRLAPGSQSPREREISRIPPNLNDHVILAGYGRVGQMIGKLLTANGIPFIAMDTDPHLVKRARTSGTSIIYGSCQRLDLLKRCHVERARLAILTFRSLEDAKRVVTQIRQLGYRCPIMVRTESEGNYSELLAAGANHVVPEMLESSLMMSAEALLLLGLPKVTVDEQIAAERQASIEQST
jgi:CPA2 family monovalent cation:H+ antiporter-2